MDKVGKREGILLLAKAKSSKRFFEILRRRIEGGFYDFLRVRFWEFVESNAESAESCGFCGIVESSVESARFYGIMESKKFLLLFACKK